VKGLAVVRSRTSAIEKMQPKNATQKRNLESISHSAQLMASGALLREGG
jgi:hypothetical protein